MKVEDVNDGGAVGGGAINILTPDPSADDRWCSPCWMQSEPEQSSSSPQGRQETTQHSLNFGPKTEQRIAKLQTWKTGETGKVVFRVGTKKKPLL